jgi:NAD(P)-dependent dehydrogenase (short-subunit alcohol dehydrogenase family)
MARYVVVGANRGIGLELAKQLAARGEQVIAACRSASPDLRATGAEVHENVDVTDDASVDRFVAAVKANGPIDVLVHVSGILKGDTYDSLDFDVIREQFEVNTLGPLCVAHAFAPFMKTGGKIGILSSRVGSLADNTSGGNYGYRISKAAVNMAGVNLAHDLESLGIAVLLLHPGFVQTEMTGGRGYIGPEESARGLIKRLDELGIEQTGTFWHADGTRLPW